MKGKQRLGIKRVDPRDRKNVLSVQGAPKKALPFRDALYQWFVDIKGSVKVRISHKYVLANARRLLSEIRAATGAAGLVHRPLARNHALNGTPLVHRPLARDHALRRSLYPPSNFGAPPAILHTAVFVWPEAYGLGPTDLPEHGSSMLSVGTCMDMLHRLTT